MTADKTPNVSLQWTERVAGRAGVSAADAEDVLAKARIQPSPIIASPKRLLLTQIAFSGHKNNVAHAGPFTFDWAPLAHGPWALLSDKNFRGKSTVLEVVRWMLRGRAPDGLQQDVRAWIVDCTLRFRLDATPYRVSITCNHGEVIGELAREFEDSARIIAPFVGDDQFSAVMSNFFMREFGLHDIVRWTGGAEDEGGRPVVHGWPSLMTALCIGTDYSALLGEVPPTAGAVTPMLQMFLGLPWVPTITAARAAEQATRREAEAREKRHRATIAARTSREAELKSALAEQRRALENLPTDEHLRVQLVEASARLLASKRRVRDAQAALHTSELALTDAERAHAEDRRELLAHDEAEAAGAVFRALDPAVCPRCDCAIDDARKAREQESHECSVCGEHLISDDSAAARRLAIDARVRASAAAVIRLQSQVRDARSTVTGAQQEDVTLEALCADSEARMSAPTDRRRMEREIAALEGRLAELAERARDAASGNDVTLRVLSAACHEAETLLKLTQGDMLARVSTRITDYARRFGMENLTAVQLRGNATLPVTKGGQATSFSKLTPGEKLRLKVATVLAMLSVGELLGIGRHPGLLLVDSPGAQEVAPDDVEQLVRGLVEVSKDLEHVQIFVAARASPAIVRTLAADRVRYARGDEYLW